MRRSLLLVAVGLLATAALTLAQTSTNYDCHLSSLTLTTNLGTSYVLNPPFDKDTTAYTLDVPFAVSSVTLTGTTVMQGHYYIGYSVSTPTSNGKLVAQGDVVASGSPGPSLALQVGDNNAGAMTTCSYCHLLYTIAIKRASMSYTKGDPLFAGLLGQQYQVRRADSSLCEARQSASSVK
jgi:hypothetical protein